MITVIDNYYPENNLAEGMNLSDTLDNMVLAVHEVTSDLMFSALLTEHAYLQENATEIVYFDEAGNDTNAGAGIKKKFADAVESVRRWFATAFEKIIDFISDHTANLRAKFATIGINGAKYKDAINNLKANNVEHEFKVTQYAARSVGNLAADPSDFIDALPTNKKIYSKAGEWLSNNFTETGKSINPSGNSKLAKDLMDYAGDVVFGESLIKDIKKARKDADDKLIGLKKNFIKEGGENLGEKLGQAKDALNSNSIVCKDKIKLFNKHFLANVDIVKAVIASSKKYNRDTKKAEDEAKFNSSTVGRASLNARAAANNIGSQVSNAAKRAGESISDKATEIKAGFGKRK